MFQNLGKSWFKMCNNPPDTDLGRIRRLWRNAHLEPQFSQKFNSWSAAADDEICVYESERRERELYIC